MGGPGQAGDVSQRDTQLIEENFHVNRPLVWYVIRKYRMMKYAGRGIVDIDDIYQEGLSSLWHAAIHYDPNGAKFSTYACSCIRFGIMRMVQSNYSRSVATPPGTLRYLRDRDDSDPLRKKLSPAVREPAEYNSSFGYTQSSHNERLVMDSGKQAMERIVARDFAQVIMAAARRINPRDAEIMFDVVGRGEILKDVAKKHGISKQRACCATWDMVRELRRRLRQKWCKW